MDSSSWDIGAGVLAACIQETLLASEIAARRRDSDAQAHVRHHIHVPAEGEEVGERERGPGGRRTAFRPAAYCSVEHRDHMI